MKTFRVVLMLLVFLGAVFRRASRLILMLLVFLGAVFLCACNLQFEFQAGAGIAAGDRLPEPDIWRSDPSPLTPVQQARQAEVDAHVLAQYGNYKIVKTTQGYSGDLYDWIETSTMALPVEIPPLPWVPEDLVPLAGAETSLSELAEFPELLGPAGTTPLIRPDFSAYVMGNTGATSLQDYLDNYQVFGTPGVADRLYAGLVSTQFNHGLSGTVNHFAGNVEDDTFSLVEFAVSCPAIGEVQELVGVVLSIDRKNFKYADYAKPRLHVESYRQVGGQLKGGWDTRQGGFVPYSPEWNISSDDFVLRGHTPLTGQVDVSEVDGMPVEHRLDIFHAPSGDWWIAYNGNLLGHYPAGLFTMLNSGACKASWYEEVYDGTPEDWTTTDMGSGHFASAGFGKADYIRRPKIRDPYWIELDPIDTSLTPANPNVAECYSRSDLVKDDVFVGQIFFCAGPGGDAPTCHAP